MFSTVSFGETTNEETVRKYVDEITKSYPNVKPELVMSVIYHESRFNSTAKTGNCLGLMQISTRWHKDRAKRLGVTDFYDPYSNILLGVDYLSDLTTQHEDIRLVLMLYNMNHKTAFKLYKQGKTSKYALSVLDMAEKYKKGE
ncbi:MAG: lytic transglycosylase domain-containing protein [Flavobacteriaceae bacterium]|nr:lytic transglycosylase domain-containing protein [Flavobacteriaceae bacterium]